VSAASRVKVSNISNFCERCGGKIFRGGTISPPKALIWGEKPGKNLQFLQKNYGILSTWSVPRFFGPKLSPALDFSPPGPVRPPFSFPNDLRSYVEMVANILGEGRPGVSPGGDTGVTASGPVGKKLSQPSQTIHRLRRRRMTRKKTTVEAHQ